MKQITTTSGVVCPTHRHICRCLFYELCTQLTCTFNVFEPSTTHRHCSPNEPSKLDCMCPGTGDVLSVWDCQGKPNHTPPNNENLTTNGSPCLSKDVVRQPSIANETQTAWSRIERLSSTPTSLSSLMSNWLSSAQLSSRLAIDHSRSVPFLKTHRA